MAKIAYVLGALPKSAHPRAKKALAGIWNAKDRCHALDTVKGFGGRLQGEIPNAVAKITDDVEGLLEVYDLPAEAYIHLRSTTRSLSTFATVRHRRKVTRGPRSQAARLAMAMAMASKLIEAAQDRWRR